MSVLVIAAHPDDEVLGCGGAVAKYRKQGVPVAVVFLCDGVSSRSEDKKIDLMELHHRRNCAERACNILGAESVSFSDFPDNQLDTIPLLDVVKVVEKYLNQYMPSIVMTHHAGDLNIDHRVTHQAVVTACRPQNDNKIKTLLFYEVPSSTEWQMPNSAPVFTPNWFIDIADVLPIKMEALEVYMHEMREWPHPRSMQGVQALTQWRGATVSVEAAEAFVLGRHIE